MIRLSPIQKLLLDALSVQAHRPETAVLTTLPHSQWQTLLALAEAQSVTPLLTARLAQKGLLTAVPTSIRQELNGRFLVNTVRNRLLLRALTELAAALHAAQIPTIVLKGGFLAHAVYARPGARVLGDLDLLVPQSALAEAAAITTAAGYQPRYFVDVPAHVRRHHHLPAFTHPQQPITVEWHWHITRPERPYTIPIEPLWQRAKPAGIPGTPLLTLAPEDLLLHLALHLSYHHEFTFGLRGLCDVDAVTAVYADRLDWDAVVQRAQQWRWQRGVYLTLRLAQALLGTAVPPPVLTALKPPGMEDKVIMQAAHQLFVDPIRFRLTPPAVQKLYTHAHPAARLRVLRQTLFPPPDRMQMLYGVQPGSARYTAARVQRWGSLLWRAAQKIVLLPRYGRSLHTALRRRRALAAWLAQPES